MTSVEYASAARPVGSAYEGLARWAGVPLETVLDYARDDRLGQLVERRQYVRPLSGAEALRRLDELKYAPGSNPRLLLGEMRAMKAVWDAEEELRRCRDVHERLVELHAKKIPPWQGLI